jgi:hypothetical protein
LHVRGEYIPALLVRSSRWCIRVSARDRTRLRAMLTTFQASRGTPPGVETWWSPRHGSRPTVGHGCETRIVNKALVPHPWPTVGHGAYFSMSTSRQLTFWRSRITELVRYG